MDSDYEDIGSDVDFQEDLEVSDISFKEDDSADEDELVRKRRFSRTLAADSAQTRAARSSNRGMHYVLHSNES